MCRGTPVHPEQTVRGRGVRPNSAAANAVPANDLMIRAAKGEVVDKVPAGPHAYYSCSPRHRLPPHRMPPKRMPFWPRKEDSNACG